MWSLLNSLLRAGPKGCKIGHLKSDHRMDRNYLKGIEGDRINALLAGIGANTRKLLAAFWHAHLKWLVCWLKRADFGLSNLCVQPRPWPL